MNAARSLAAACAVSLIAATAQAAPTAPGAAPPPGAPILLRAANPMPPPLPPAPGGQYYYNDNGKPAGPFTLAEIKARIDAGQIKPGTLMWKAGSPQWLTAKDIAEIAALFGGPAPAASACNGKLLLADDFKRLDANWERGQGDPISIEDNKIKMKPGPGKMANIFYKGKTFQDIDACVTVQMPNKFNVLSRVMGGIIFMAKDANNYYAFVVSPSGRAGVMRKLNGDYRMAVNFIPVVGMQKLYGSKNMLHLSVSGDAVTLEVNGKVVAKAIIEVPDGGGRIGLFAQTEDKQSDAWKFLELKVTDAPH